MKNNQSKTVVKPWEFVEKNFPLINVIPEFDELISKITLLCKKYPNVKVSLKTEYASIKLLEGMTLNFEVMQMENSPFCQKVP